MEDLFLSQDGAFPELENEDSSSARQSSMFQMEDVPNDTLFAVVGVCKERRYCKGSDSDEIALNIINDIVATCDQSKKQKAAIDLGESSRAKYRDATANVHHRHRQSPQHP